VTQENISYLRPSTSVPQSSLSPNSLEYKNTKNECICEVKKQYLSHWIFTQITNKSHKFKVGSLNSWDCHPVLKSKLSSILKNYVILAKRDNTPLVIEHEQTISVLFHVDILYQETQIILSNFVNHYSKLILNKAKLGRTLKEAEEKEKIEFLNFGIVPIERIPLDKKMPKSKSVAAIKPLFNTEQEYNKFKGISYDKAFPALIIAGNSFNKKSVKIDKNAEKKELLNINTLQKTLSKYFFNNSIGSSWNFQFLNSKYSANSKYSKNSRNSQTSASLYGNLTSKNMMNQAFQKQKELLKNEIENLRMRSSMVQNKSENNEIINSKHDIRKTLHPNISIEFLDPGKVWLI